MNRKVRGAGFEPANSLRLAPQASAVDHAGRPPREFSLGVDCYLNNARNYMMIERQVKDPSAALNWLISSGRGRRPS